MRRGVLGSVCSEVSEASLSGEVVAPQPLGSALSHPPTVYVLMPQGHVILFFFHVPGGQGINVGALPAAVEQV